jgi:seryl-tRNA synthetase
MIDPRMIRENIEAVNAALAKRQASFDAGRLVELDGERRRLIQETEKLKNEKNTLSNEIAKLRKVRCRRRRQDRVPALAGQEDRRGQARVSRPLKKSGSSSSSSSPTYLTLPFPSDDRSG